MVVMQGLTGSRQEEVPLRGRLHLSEICLDSAFLAENSYLLLISPKDNRAGEGLHFKTIIAGLNLTAKEKND